MSDPQGDNDVMAALAVLTDGIFSAGSGRTISREEYDAHLKKHFPEQWADMQPAHVRIEDHTNHTH